MTMQPAGWYPDPADSSRLRWWDGEAWADHVARDGASWIEQLPVAEPPIRSRRRMPWWAWILVGVAALGVFWLLSPVVAVIALVVLVTGIIALAKGTRTWLRLRSRRATIGVTAAAAVVLLASGSVSAATLANTSSQSSIEAVPFAATGAPSQRMETAKPTPTSTPTPTPVETTRDEVVTEPVAFTETRVDDGTIASGQTQMRTAGQNGEKALTYRVHLLDGQEVSRELLSETVTREPVTQVVAVGTYVAPPPPPAPAPAAPAGGCDSNYADACVPVSSDVDCAGGSGNGPAYFSGVARVVGRDIYDLDRDGDGFACEPY